MEQIKENEKTIVMEEGRRNTGDGKEMERRWRGEDERAEVIEVRGPDGEKQTTAGRRGSH